MLVMAHRGYSGVYPENTMLAFREAASDGCDGVERDVHETKDGQLVVIHAEAVDRTTDGKGWVKDLTLAQEASRALRVPIPMSNACMAVYEQGRAAGLGGEDMSAIIKVWERLCGVEIRAEG